MPDPVDNVRRSRRAPAGAARRAAQTSKSPDETAAAQETSQTGFQQVLAGVSGRPGEKRLGEILEEIKGLSKLLARRRLLEDVESYRLKVGEFLRVYLDEVLDVREAAGRRGSMRRKQMIVVKKVNVELEELSRMVLGGAPDFRILKELGTIEGLLMDLYR